MNRRVNAVADWLEILRLIREVSGSNPDGENAYSVEEFSCSPTVSPGKILGNYVTRIHPARKPTDS